MSEPDGGGWAAPGGGGGYASPPPPPGASAGPRVPLGRDAPLAAGPGPAPATPPAWTGQQGWGGDDLRQSGHQQGWGGDDLRQSGQQQGWDQQQWGQQQGWGAPQPGPPKPGVVPLRPLGLGEMLDGAVGLVRGYPRPALAVSAVVALVSTLVQLVLLFTLLRPLFDVDPVALEAGDPQQLVGLAAGAGSAGLVTGLLSVVTGAVMTGFLSAVAGKAVLGEPLTLAELWRTTKGKLWRLVGGAVLYLVVLAVPFFVGTLLFALLAGFGGTAGAGIGGLLFAASLVVTAVVAVRLSLAAPVIVLEDARVVTAFRRSSLLVRRSAWRVLGIVLLTVFISSFVTTVLQLPFTLLSGGGPLGALSGGAAGFSTRALVLSTVGAGIAATLVAPFTAGVRALLYIDRRMRAEGLDVALQAAAAARP